MSAEIITPYANDPAHSGTANNGAESLGDEIAVLFSCLYAAEARLLDRIHRFDAERCFETLGFHSTAHWLNYRCGIGMNGAREKVRVANALPGLPKIHKAFAKGRLSYSKIRALTRIASPENEDYLLMFATYGTAHHVEKLVSKTRRATRLQDESAAEAIHAGRELNVSYDENGAVVLRGRFPAEQGALIVRALEFAMDQAFGAPAGGDSDDAARDSEADAVTTVTSTPVPVAARRADALAAVAETFLNNPDHCGSTADRYQVVVHVGPEQQADNGREYEVHDLPHSRTENKTHRSETGGVTAVTLPEHVTAVTPHLESGPHVTAETSRRIACDCSVVPIRENMLGEPLAIGRKSRSIPPAIRRALQFRDDGCHFPGCTHTRYVDGHHIEHWADGGETSLQNLVLLCRHHHRLVHEGGFGCERRAGGEIVFTDRQARPLDENPGLPGFASDLDAWLDRQVLEGDIDQDSCRARMDATDRVDWDFAVGTVFG